MHACLRKKIGRTLEFFLIGRRNFTKMDTLNNHLLKIPQFNPTEIALEKYLVLPEANFSKYKVTDENKKNNFKIVSLGTKVFDTLSNIIASDLPSGKKLC